MTRRREGNNLFLLLLLWCKIRDMPVLMILSRLQKEAQRRPT